jgi:hypothetical protein
MRYDFKCESPSWVHNYDNEFQITVVNGSIGDAIDRKFIADNVNSDKLTYDTQSDKVFKRPNNLILLQGAVTNDFYWDSDIDIKSSDIERLKELNSYSKIKNGIWTESTTEEALLNKSYNTTYKFAADHDVLVDNSLQWSLATSGKIEATEDATRLFCFLSNRDDYKLKILDIPVGETKNFSKEKETTYAFFSQNCTVNGGLRISKYSCKKVKSDLLEIKNEVSKDLRIIIMER